MGALESLGWDQPNDYSYEFRNRYCAELWRIAKTVNLPLRTVDKALWQYSREQQERKRKAASA